MNIHLNLQDNDIYQNWRDKKLNDYPTSVENLIVKIDKPGHPNKREIMRIRQICNRANMVIYEGPEKILEDKRIALNMGHSIGLSDIERSLTTERDGVSELSVSLSGAKSNYIPYSNNPLGWHTDGCYNDLKHPINGFLLHCVRAAENGGENYLLDPDIAYILLREENPEFIDGLTLPDTLTIPSNVESGIIKREKRVGPALSFHSINGSTCDFSLHFRYTSRKSHVIWKEDTRTIGALDFLRKILESENPYIFRIKLKSGSGLIGNNILHNRTKFKDSEHKISKRLIYRIYYRDRVTRI